MLLILFFLHCKSKNRICICNKECYAECESHYLDASLSNNTKYMKSLLKKEKELELYFFSKYKGFTFPIDSSYYYEKKLTIKVHEKSEPIFFKIKERFRFFPKTIEIKPNHEIVLPNINPFPSSKKNILEDQTLTSTVPISVPISQMNIEGDMECNFPENQWFNTQYNCQNYINNFESQNSFSCGLYCWSNSSNFKYTFKGVLFSLYGAYGATYSTFDVELDGKIIATINEFNSVSVDHALIYTSDLLDYNEHTVRVIHKGKLYGFYKLAYWPSIKARRANITEFETKGDVQKEADGIGGIRLRGEVNSQASITLSCSKFWIYGVKSPDLSEFKLSFEGKTEVISQYSDKKTEGVLIYESPDSLFVNTKFTFSSENNVMNIYCIYYEEPHIPISIGPHQMKVQNSMTIACSKYGETNRYLLMTVSDSQRVGCDLNANFDEVKSYKCGLVCQTSSGTYTYNFVGVKIAVYGSYGDSLGQFNVEIDGKVAVVDEKSKISQERVLVYVSDDLEYKEHIIKITPKNGTFSLYKLAFWPSKTAKRLNSTSFIKYGNFVKESDGVGGFREYNESLIGSKKYALAQLQCTKFWIYGLRDQSSGNMTFHYNGITEAVDTYLGSGKLENELIYESKDINYASMTLTVSTDKKLMLYCIYYEAPEPKITPVPISVGLKQTSYNGTINCNNNHDTLPTTLDSNINIQEFGCDFNNINSPDAYQCGLRCWCTNCNYEYTFKGVKFSIFGSFKDVHGKFDVEFDGKIIAEINTESVPVHYVPLYDSSIYEYKEHTVKIHSKGDIIEIYKIVYWPSITAKRLNSTDFFTYGGFHKESDGIGGFREYSDINQKVHALIPLRCSKFWFYSFKEIYTSSVTIHYNGLTTIAQTFSDTGRVENALIYESDDLECSNITLTLTANKVLMLEFIYFEPPKSEIPSVPISVSLNQMKFEGNIACATRNNQFSTALKQSINLHDLGCSYVYLNDPESYQCGLRCWSADSNYEYVFKGVKFALLGTFAPNHGKFDILLDGVKVAEINEESVRHDYSFLYESNVIVYKEHTVSIRYQQNNLFELYKLVYWPSTRAKRFNESDIPKLTNRWRRETDGIGGVQAYSYLSKNNLYGAFSKTFSCTKLWFYGATLNSTKYMNISYDNIYKYIDQYSEQQFICKLLEESNEFAYKEITFRGDTFMISFFQCLYYHEKPSKFEYINKTFNNCLPFFDIYIYSTSDIEQISGCLFNDISEDFDYFIKLEKEVLFFDNVFQYDQEQQEGRPAPIKVCYNQKLTILNCSFINANVRTDGGGIVFYSSDEYSINAVFESCKFINCGKSNNKSVIKVEGINSFIKLNNCSFVYTNENSSNIVEATCSNVIINDCEFIKTGLIYIYLPSKLRDQPVVLENPADYSITNCVFESSYFVDDSNKNLPICIFFEVEIASSLEFENNTFANITNLKSNNSNIHFIEINAHRLIDQLAFRNLSFLNNACSSLYGGGSGFIIKNVLSLTFIDCKFIKNEARKSTMPRSTEMSGIENYYSGDGGGFQIGFGCDVNEVAISFQNCIFKNNHAQRHGGALAIQTLRTVEIVNCVFENNHANYDFSSSNSELLYENHFNKKSEGRGGSIYINPSYSYLYNNDYCYDNTKYMTSVSIMSSTFSFNSAQDGYAIYIEGDDPGTEFVIQNNKFSNNFNFGTSASSDPNITERGVITTEIHSVTKGLMKSNNFTDFHYDELAFVDHFGNRILDPKPTATPSATPVASPIPEPVSTPLPYSIPISVPLHQMKITGGKNCVYSLDETQSNCMKYIDDLENELAYKCGNRCWTNKADFEYTFKGVKFCVYGTYDPNFGSFYIELDDIIVKEINENYSPRKEYVLLFTSDLLEYKEHKIKIRNKGEMFELYKLVFWPSVEAKRINSTDFSKNFGWKKESDGIGGVRHYKEFGGEASVTISCKKFWFYGMKSNHLESFSLSYKNVAQEINQFSSERIECALMYESPELFELEMVINLASEKSFVIYCIYYEEINVPISIGIHQMEYEGDFVCLAAHTSPFHISLMNPNLFGCDYNNLNSPNAYNCGIKCWTNGFDYGNLHYKFKGMKFAIYGTNDINHGSFNVRIDNKTIIEVNERAQRKEKIIVYISETLEYGEHEIDILWRGEVYEIYKLVYWPTLRAKRLNSTEFLKYGNFIDESDGIGGVRSYSNDIHPLSLIQLHCNKFWFYGIKDQFSTNVTLNFNGNKEVVDMKSNKRLENELLYESPDMNYIHMTLTMSSDDFMMLYCIYYEEPPNPEITPIPISVGLTQMKYSGYCLCNNYYDNYSISLSQVDINKVGCNYVNLEVPEAYQCGVRCICNNGNYEYTFKGVKFAVYGSYSAKYGTFRIAYDYYNYGVEINEESAPLKYAILYESDVLYYGEHNIRIKLNMNEHIELYKIVYWPSMKSTRLNSTDFIKKGSNWETETDGIGGVRQFSYSSDGFYKTFPCTKLWFYGSKHKQHGTMQYSFDNYSGIVDNYHDQTQEDGLLLIESDDFSYRSISFDAIVSGKSVLYCAYYKDDPWKYEYINKTFVNTLPYFDIYIWSDSLIDQISGCRFISIDEKFDYFIKLEKEVLIFDNEFNNSGHFNSSPIKICYNGKIKISNCLFKSYTKTVVYCNEDYIINSTIDSCIFSDCVLSQNGVIAIGNQDSVLNVFNCHFESNCKQSIEAKCSSVFVDNCIFTESGSVYLNSQASSTNPNKRFVITNSMFNSSLKNINNNLPICIDISASSPFTITFENNIVSNNKMESIHYSHLITLDGNNVLKEIEIKNITFVNNICYSLYGGGSGINFLRFQHVSITECKFINNVAAQSSSSRSAQLYDFGPQYYSGDGGGIQIGFGCNMNEVDVVIERCIFKKNKAQKHGGAIAIQTLKTVEINECEFEENEANFNIEASSQLLFENHYHKKNEGRGGAIYINPAYKYEYFPGFTCYDMSLYMTDISIKNCIFYLNSAYDGYAIYVEGDDLGTKFDINSNNFTDNYNFGPSERDDPNITVRGVIATEIHSITNEIYKYNNFSKVYSKRLIYVDHYGSMITKEFTLSQYFSESNEFSSSIMFSKSNKFSQSNKFSRSNKFSQPDIYSMSKEFSESNEFSRSNEFNIIGMLSTSLENSYISDVFSQSQEFSQTRKFTKTNEFSASDKLNIFSVPNEQSKSDDFSTYEELSSLKEFSKSKIFSSSDEFSKSKHFTQTEQFSCSYVFESFPEFSKNEEYRSSNIFPSFSFINSNDKSFEVSESDQFESTQSLDDTETTKPSYLTSIYSSNLAEISKESNSFESAESENHYTSEQNEISSSFESEYHFSQTQSEISASLESEYHSSSEQNEISASFVSEYHFSQTQFETLESFESVPHSPYEQSEVSPSFDSLQSQKTISGQFETVHHSSQTIESESLSQRQSEFSKTEQIFRDAPLQPTQKKKSNLPMIIGIIVGLILLIAAIAIIVIFIVRKKAKKSSSLEEATTQQASSAETFKSERKDVSFVDDSENDLNFWL